MALVNKDTAEKLITGHRKTLLFRTKHYGTQQHSTSQDRANRYAYHGRYHLIALHKRTNQETEERNCTEQHIAKQKNTIDRLISGNSHNAAINTVIKLITRQDATEQNARCKTLQNIKMQNRLLSLVKRSIINQTKEDYHYGKEEYHN